MAATGPSPELLTELKAALTTAVDFGNRKLGAPLWQPTAGSEAAGELANAEARCDGSPWGEPIPRTSYAAANLLMTGVLDNLGSLWRLLADPITAIGPTVIARSAIEIGATAWWLMEPGIGTRRRACRELVLSLTSARRAAEVAEELSDPEGKAEGLAQEANVLKRITDQAIAAPTGRRYSPVIEGETLPQTTRLTAGMLRACFPVGVPTTSFYRSYSAVTHGQIYGLMSFMTPTEQPDGRTLLTWHLPPPILDSTIQTAIVAFREPLKRINRVMGWSQIEYDLWAAKLDKILSAARPDGTA